MNKKQLLAHLRSQHFPERILKAFEKIKREDFIPELHKKYAYEDTPIPIHKNRATTSQPYTIAFMLDKLELKKDHKVLEIGSGSGYVLALINNITNSKVYGVEIIKELSEKSKQALKKYKDITVINKSGKNGLLEYAPYDRILVSADTNKISKEILGQLREGGIIVAPVKTRMIKIKKEKGKIIRKDITTPGYYFVFVPLVDG